MSALSRSEEYERQEIEYRQEFHQHDRRLSIMSRCGTVALALLIANGTIVQLPALIDWPYLVSIVAVNALAIVLGYLVGLALLPLLWTCLKAKSVRTAAILIYGSAGMVAVLSLLAPRALGLNDPTYALLSAPLAIATIIVMAIVCRCAVRDVPRLLEPQFCERCEKTYRARLGRGCPECGWRREV